VQLRLFAWMRLAQRKLLMDRLKNMKLLTNETFGALELRNRVVMAPLTRMRAQTGDVPGELAAQYYAQRASAGLIISEAAQISALAKGYPATPGIYSDEQVPHLAYFVAP